MRILIGQIGSTRSPRLNLARQRLVCAGLISIAAIAVLTQASVAGTSGPTTQPTSGSARSEFARLVAQLGDPNYARREEAQSRLKAAGEAALSALLERVDDPDPEIARRVMEVLPLPRDGDARVQAAIRLLETSHREALARAVEWLFVDPGATLAAFERAAASRTGRTAAMCGPILEQLRDFVHQDSLALKRIEEARKSKPDTVSRLEANYRRMRPDSIAVQAEAAYWLALDARDSYTTTSPTSAPADRPR